MGKYEFLPSFDEFEAECKRQGVAFDSRISSDESVNPFDFAPHSLLRALGNATWILRRTPEAQLLKSEQHIDTNPFAASTAATALARIINGAAKLREEPAPPAYNFKGDNTNLAQCGHAEGYFARTVLSWVDSAKQPCGDIFVDTEDRPVLLRKAYPHGANTTLVLGEGVYMQGVPCPKGALVDFRCFGESRKLAGGKLSIIPLDLLRVEGRLSMLRMTMYGLEGDERLHAFKDTPAEEILPPKGQEEEIIKLSVDEIRGFAGNAIDRAARGLLECVDERKNVTRHQ